MDIFKEKCLSKLGPGGFKCHCCTYLSNKKGHKDKSFNRRIRRILKHLLKKEIQLC